jgi:hypothetical protein
MTVAYGRAFLFDSRGETRSMGCALLETGEPADIGIAKHCKIPDNLK